MRRGEERRRVHRSNFASFGGAVKAIRDRSAIVGRRPDDPGQGQRPGMAGHEAGAVHYTACGMHGPGEQPGAVAKLSKSPAESAERGMQFIRANSSRAANELPQARSPGGLSRALNRNAQRLHEAMLDRDAVAARDDALLIVGIDAAWMKIGPSPSVQERPQFIGAGQIGHRLDTEVHAAAAAARSTPAWWRSAACRSRCNGRCRGRRSRDSSAA